MPIVEALKREAAREGLDIRCVKPALHPHGCAARRAASR